MNRSRLAQILAQAIGPDGKPDQAKIFDALQITPDAPEAILIDAFVATEESLRELAAKQTLHVEAVKKALDGELKQLVQALVDQRRGIAMALKVTDLAMAEQGQMIASAVKATDKVFAVRQAELNEVASRVEAGCAKQTDLGKQLLQAADTVTAAYRKAAAQTDACHAEVIAASKDLAQRASWQVASVWVINGLLLGAGLTYYWFVMRS